MLDRQRPYTGRVVDGYIFPYASNYSVMNLLQVNGMQVVEKRYGQEQSSEGHSMRMTLAEATEMSRYAAVYTAQVACAGVRIPRLYHSGPIKLANGNFGVHIQQEFIRGINLQDLWVQAVEAGDSPVQENVLDFLLRITKRVHELRPTNGDGFLYPYIPPEGSTQVPLAIDLKPNNFIVPTEEQHDPAEIPEPYLVDIMYPPTRRPKDGMFAFLNIRPDFIQKDPGWAHLSYRLRDLLSFFPKTNL